MQINSINDEGNDVEWPTLTYYIVKVIKLFYIEF